MSQRNISVVKAEGFDIPLSVKRLACMLLITMKSFVSDYIEYECWNLCKHITKVHEFKLKGITYKLFPYQEYRVAGKLFG